MLAVEHLEKSFGQQKVVHDLQLHISKGSVYGFIGPNGAGKTTTMKMIAGLLPPDCGSIYIDGEKMQKEDSGWKRKIGYMPDFFGVYDNLKVKEYLEFYASLYGMVGREVSRNCNNLLELVHLEENQDSFVDTLSRGMKQRLCLARCLVHDPVLLILDEPASGVDPRSRYEMKEIIRELAQRKKTIMISSHLLPDLAKMCDSMGIMERGRMVLSGGVEEILKRAREDSFITIKVLERQEDAVAVLKENPRVESLAIRKNQFRMHFAGDEKEESELLATLVAKNIPVLEFAKENGNLEELFIQLTKGQEVMEIDGIHKPDLIERNESWS